MQTAFFLPMGSNPRLKNSRNEKSTSPFIFYADRVVGSLHILPQMIFPSFRWSFDNHISFFLHLPACVSYAFLVRIALDSWHHDSFDQPRDVLVRAWTTFEAAVLKEIVAATTEVFCVGHSVAVLAVGVAGTEPHAPCTVGPLPCDARAHDSCGTLFLVAVAAVVVSTYSSPPHD